MALNNPEDVDNFVAQARAKGYSRDEVQAYLGQRIGQFRDQARQQGYSDAQIDGYLGYKNPRQGIQQLQVNAQQNLAAHPVTPQEASDPATAFLAGLQRSSGGLIARGKLPDIEVGQRVGWLTRLASSAGEFAGDVPAMVAGAIGGAAAGGAAGAAGGAAVPGAGETGLSEVAGGISGATLGGGAGSTALPQFIKSAYVDGLKKGFWTSPTDFAQRASGILWDTTKAGIVGAATGAVGGKIGQALEGMGTAINPIAKATVKTAAELGTMSTVAAGLEGRLPTRDDILDGAALLAFFHVAGAGAGAATRAVVRNAKDNLADHWATTEQAPAITAQQAMHDPVLRTRLQSPPIPQPRPASAHASTPDGDFVMQRIPGKFDDEVKFIINTQEGGGKVISDTGGTTKWGISQKANPDLDVKNLTQEQAQQVLHDRYYLPVGADKIADPRLRLAAFDSAVNEGVGPTKEWLKQAGGDLQTFLALRTAKYKQLLENQPEKYGQFENAWNERLKRLGATSTIRGMETPPPGEPPSEPPEPPRPDWGGEDPWENVRRTMMDFDEPTKGNTLDGLKEVSQKVYTEFFNPQHPINRLIDAAEKGGDLPDLDNPRIAARFAETSPTLAQYAIERGIERPDGSMIPALKGILPEAPEDYRRFLVYGKAKWALEKAGQEKLTGVEVDDARRVAADGDKEFGDKFKQLVAWQNGTLGWLRDSGILSDAGYKASIEENLARIPGYREQEPGKGGVGGPGSTTYNPIKRFLGSDKRTQPILESLLHEAFLRRELADRNSANLALADYAEASGQGRKVSASFPKMFNLTDAEIQKLGADPGALEDGANEIWRRLAAGLKDDQVPIFRDGKMEVWQFDDPEVTRYLRGFDRTSLNTFQKFASYVANFNRKMIVMSPDFPLRNIGYDVPWRFIVDPGFRNTLQGAFVGLRHILGDTPEYDEWLRSGGAERVFGGMSQSEYIKDVMKGYEDPGRFDMVWNTLSNAYGGLRYWAQLWSQAPRVGRYVQGLKEGEAPDVAAAASTEAGFHRAGFGGPAAKNINAITPFLLAHLNGLEQTIRGQFGIGKTITGEKFNALQFTLKASALITLPVLANWFFSKDEPWYKGVPDEIKDNGILLHVGPSDGGITYYHKLPPLLSFIYGGIPRRLAEAFLNDNPHAADGIAKSFGVSLIPSSFVTSNVLLPIVEHIANHSFYRDRPIVPDDIRQHTMAPEQFTMYSSDTARQLSKWMSDMPLLKDFKLAPPDIDNFLHAYGGTIGAGMVQAAETAYHTFKGDRPEATIQDWPLLKSFLRTYPSANAQPIQDFRDQMTQFNQVHGSLIRLMSEGDLKRFTEIVNRNPTVAILHAYRMQNEPLPSNSQEFMDVLENAGARGDRIGADNIIRAQKALDNLQTYVKFVYANEDFNPREKRQLINQAYGMMMTIGEAGNKAIRNVEAGRQQQELPDFQLPERPENTPKPAPPPVPVPVPVPGGAPADLRGQVPIA